VGLVGDEALMGSEIGEDKSYPVKSTTRFSGEGESEAAVELEVETGMDKLFNDKEEEIPEGCAGPK
jgi:hypothetical protein